MKLAYSRQKAISFAQYLVGSLVPSVDARYPVMFRILVARSRS